MNSRTKQGELFKAEISKKKTIRLFYEECSMTTSKILMILNIIFSYEK